MSENLKNQERESNENPHVEEAAKSKAPTDMSSDVLLRSFELSVEKLDSNDKRAVMEQFNKLKSAFDLLGKSVDKILSSEEGRRLFDQEVKKRQGT